MTSFTISTENIELFNKVKFGQDCSYILFGLSSDNSTVEFRGSGDKNHNFDDIKSELPENDVAIVIYDFKYETSEVPPRKTSKLILIFWCPTLAPMKRRFTLNSAESKITTSFTGIQKSFNLTDYEEVNFDVITKELR
jgi:cofilin